MVLVIVPVSITFGLTPIAVIFYGVLEGLADAFSHANVELPYALDRALRWLISTPNMHSIHHSSHQPETDSNYGQVFSMWDRLFGTYTAETRAGRRSREIGLKEIRDGRTVSFWWQIKSPLIHFHSEAPGSEEVTPQASRIVSAGACRKRSTPEKIVSEQCVAKPAHPLRRGR